MTTPSFQASAPMRMVRTAGLILAALLSFGIFFSCEKKEPTPQPDPDPTPEPDKTEYLMFNKSSAHDLDFSWDASKQTASITTTGNDPYIRLQPFAKSIPSDDCIFTFEYNAPAGLLGYIQLFFGPQEAQERSCYLRQLGPNGSNWTVFTVNLRDQRESFNWGNKGDCLRMDFGDNPGVTIKLRNLRFRSPTTEESEEERQRIDRQQNNEALAKELKQYLQTSYPSEVNNVEVTLDKVIIQGSCGGDGSFLLSEITPWMDVTRPESHSLTRELKDKNFTVELDRYATIEGVKYDRLLSKWAILKAGSGKSELVSHARYADVVAPASSPAPFPFPTKKGVEGVGIVNGENDIRTLGVGSATMNMYLNNYLSNASSAGTIETSFAKEKYYISQSAVSQRDIVIRQYNDEGTVPIGIVLIPTEGLESSQSLQILTHPECEGGNFAMPDVTTPKGVMHYAAVMNFLASRYNGQNGHGRIGHWIMHNEIDAASTWTNMGNNQPELYFMDEYLKSMRIVNNILRQYDSHACVFASFTHNWDRLDEDYKVTSLLDDLLQFSAAEGDFRWGLAMHPYPKDLAKPAFWQDDKDLSASLSTPYVTFYNLEVYDKWIRSKDHFYKGNEKRLLILSENGTNTPSYSVEDQRLQAAGACWVWKKISALDGIDAIQWHGWHDHETEYGLRIGLRKYGSDTSDPYGKKLAWYVWQAAGTPSEDEVFAPYLKVIGINSWDEIFLE